jgi:Zn-dependent alcohol dehydrogenase
MGTSTFSQYTVVHEQSVALIDQTAPLEKVRQRSETACCDMTNLQLPPGPGAWLPVAMKL